MGTEHCRISYRPVRIGWCVRNGEIEDLRRSMLYSYCMWGGVFNPVIPVGSANAKRMVSRFRVDALHAISGDSEVVEFSKDFNHLPWPFFQEGIVVEGSYNKYIQVLDLQQVVHRIEDLRTKRLLRDDWKVALFNCDEQDPLADVMCAMFGTLPSKEEVGVDYAGVLEQRLGVRRVSVKKNGFVSPDLLDTPTPASLCGFELTPDARPILARPGVYVGKADRFDDLVAFWNLRAAGIETFFVDEHALDRIAKCLNVYLSRIRERTKRRGKDDSYINVWSIEDLTGSAVLEKIGDDLMRCTVAEDIWSRDDLTPNSMSFTPHFSLCDISDEYQRLQATVRLSEKPFYDYDWLADQKLIASVDAKTPFAAKHNVTFSPPFVPQLNEFYGRNLHHNWNEVRAEPDAVGIVINTRDSHLTLSSIEHQRVVEEIFGVCGLTATASKPGRVCRRLIQQMGGLQGCRVFKIAGVRSLIQRYSADQTFTRGAAVSEIGNLDPQTRKPRFKDYESLFIEPRERGTLKPTQVFDFLLKKRVFRTGLNLECPSCELIGWVSLDHVHSERLCPFCGARFDIAPQLKDRDWAYRRSGLFGRDDNQEGAIPVALTLQQLEANLHADSMIFCPSLDVAWKSGDRDPCETDFVVVLGEGGEHPGSLKRPAVLVGECKSNGPIEESDARNLGDLADMLLSLDVTPYVVFAKTSKFGDEEIEHCKLAQAPYTERVIILSADQLEPFHITDRHKDLPGHLKYTTSVRSLAELTTEVHFKGQYRSGDGWKRPGERTSWRSTSQKAKS